MSNHLEVENQFLALIKSINWYVARGQEFDFEKWKGKHVINGNLLIRAIGDIGDASGLATQIARFLEGYSDRWVENQDVMYFLKWCHKLEEFETNDKIRALIRKAGFGENLLREPENNVYRPQQQRVVNDDHLKISPNLNVAIDALGDSNDDVEEWFSKYERKTNANLWNDRLRAIKLSDYLKSTALRYWENCTVDKTDYNVVKTELIARLKVENVSACNFYMRMQKPSESVADFALMLNSLGKRVFGQNLCEKELHKTFWSNLLPEIRHELYLSKPENLEKAVELAKIVEKVLSERESAQFVKKITQNNEKNAIETSDKDAISNFSFTNRRRSRSSSPKRNNYRRDLVCFNCGKKGHIARYCWSNNKNSDVKRSGNGSPWVKRRRSSSLEREPENGGYGYRAEKVQKNEWTPVKRG